MVFDTSAVSFQSCQSATFCLTQRFNLLTYALADYLTLGKHPVSYKRWVLPKFVKLSLKLTIQYLG